MAAGLLMVAAALVLFAYNAAEDGQAGTQAQGVAAQLAQVQLDASPSYEPRVTAPDTGEDMTVVEVDGYAYVGRLVIPTLGLDLPVMASWTGDYEALKLAPCRQFGSPQTHDLVLAGHNYTSHFGGLSRLVVGDEVEFHGMDGRTWRYRVALVETLAPTAVETVRTSPYDLTLYTCTYGGQSRVVVRCELQ